MGDNAYETGSPIDFAKCYNPSWGRFKKRTRPAPGNHDYVMPFAAAYYAYFGKQAGPAGRGYYSYDLGRWHILSLDSDQDMRTIGEQGKWIDSDLTLNTKQCILAYWHHPIFSSELSPDTNPRVRELSMLLYQYHVSVTVNGHV